MAAELVPITKAVSEGLAVLQNATPKPLTEAVGHTLADFWQGVVGDSVAAWRVRNAAQVSKKLEVKLEKMGKKVDKSRISERYAFTWFEEASKQDEPEIQELFAALLANAVNGNSDALDRRNVELVAKMTPDEAALFSEIIGKIQKRSTLFEESIFIFSEDESRFVNQIKNSNVEKNLLCLETLQAKGIVSRNLEIDSTDLNNHIDMIASYVGTVGPAEQIGDIYQDMIHPIYRLALSLTGMSLARALSPSTFE